MNNLFLLGLALVFDLYGLSYPSYDIALRPLPRFWAMTPSSEETCLMLKNALGMTQAEGERADHKQRNNSNIQTLHSLTGKHHAATVCC